MDVIVTRAHPIAYIDSPAVAGQETPHPRCEADERAEIEKWKV